MAARSKQTLEDEIRQLNEQVEYHKGVAEDWRVRWREAQDDLEDYSKRFRRLRKAVWRDYLLHGHQDALTAAKVDLWRLSRFADKLAEDADTSGVILAEHLNAYD